MLPRLPLALLFLLLAGCSRAPRVRFQNDACFIDDAPAGIAQVEREEALISQHMTQRQPLFLLVTLMVVALASAGYVLRIVDVIAWRGEDGLGFTDRLRRSLERHRAHPTRYFIMISATFLLLLVACGFYASLDSDKLASERALGLLQFCHLALRTADEHNVLSEQRQNLEALSATAGDIRTLVDKLPPDEQRKAQLVIDRVSQALDKQGKTLSVSLDKNAEAAMEERDQTEQVERGLSSVAADVLTLKSVPASLSDLEKTEGKLADDLSALNAKLDKGAQSNAELAERVNGELDALSAKLDRSASAADLAALAKKLDAVESRLRPAAPPTQVAAKPRASGPAGCKTDCSDAPGKSQPAAAAAAKPAK